jgi:hypothetical protein
MLPGARLARLAMLLVLLVVVLSLLVSTFATPQVY